MTTLGIDVSKSKFDVALLRNGKYRTKVLPNTPAGLRALATWLEQHGVEKSHACLESTGTYGDALTRFLFDAGHVVSVVNPARIKAFGESELLRTKNDKTDSRLIARFCEAMKPAAWAPDPPEIEELRALGRRRDALMAMRTQELNRLGVSVDAVNASIEAVVKTLDEEIRQISKRIDDHIDNHPGLKKKRDLLRSIPGVGDVTIEAILSEVNAFERFDTINQVVAYMGLSPKEKTSGSSVRGRSTICKIGSARLRRVLYMPALSASRCNPFVRALRERLKEKSKHGMVIACACMKKLVHIIFGVIKNGKPFDPMFAAKTA